MAFLSNLAQNLLFAVNVVKNDMPKGMWEWLIANVFSFIQNYGWRVIVFTLFLKLALFPMDYYQRKLTFDNNKKMEVMKPEMEKLQKHFGHDRMLLSQKQRELQKRYKYNAFGSCLPLIATLAIFITMVTGFNRISTYMNLKVYNEMVVGYNQAYDLNKDEVTGSEAEAIETEIDGLITTIKANQAGLSDIEAEVLATLEFCKENYPNYDISFENHFKDYELTHTVEETLQDKLAYLTLSKANKAEENAQAALTELAAEAALNIYENENESWLWVKNLWRADSNVKPIPTLDEFNKLIKGNTISETDYNAVMQKTAAKYNNTWNGYFILIALAVGVTVFSQWTAKLGQPKMPDAAGGDMMAGQMKMMMWMMPIMMGFFAFSYSSAFTLYIVTNSLLSAVISLGINYLLQIRYKKQLAKNKTIESRYANTINKNR